MANIVGGFLLPHDPLITGEPDAPSPEQKKAVLDAFSHITERLRALEVDTVIVVGDDHYTVFGPHNLPRYLIAVGEVDGPAENWIQIERAPIKNNTALASHIMQFGFDNGFDWAVAKDITVDHSVTVPVHLSLRALPEVRTIPVYINSGVEPLISSQRCYQLGQMMAKAVESWQGDERVAILGTGGVSHWVGMAQMGHVAIEWDKKIMDAVERGDHQALMDLSDSEIIEDAGNGALEIKNWLVALGFMGDGVGETIDYVPVNEWVTGCGFSEIGIR